MQYLASIKVHDPCRAGVLVELHGEFDVACLESFRQTLRRASDLGEPTFVDVSGVTFMDTLCLKELAAGSGTLSMCHPSWQFELGVAACGLEESILVLPDGPGYEAVIAEACGCERVQGNGGPTMALLLNEAPTGLLATRPLPKRGRKARGRGRRSLEESYSHGRRMEPVRTNRSRAGSTGQRRPGTSR